jgi:RNA polymerase sigma-70 factor, ECF subfamily
LISEEARYRSLMMAALAGDQVAYRTLLSELRRHLQGYYLRRLGPDRAEGVVQEVLIGIHTRRGTYDPSRPFTAWVYGIARYKLVDEYRRARRRVTVPLDEAEELFTADEAAAATAQRDVERLLAKLPEAKRRLLRLVKLDGEPVAEVARQTSMSAAAVKVAVHRALKSLSDNLQDDDANR